MARGLAETREKAKAMIMAGVIEVNGQRADKPGVAIPTGADILVRRPYPSYVSRGGLKLEAALAHFPVDVESKTIIDVGASTGGFTDCLLQKGARKIIALDVGYGQLDWRLRKDPRVVVMEKTNIRYVTAKDIGEPLNGAVIDVSFISLKRVLPPLSQILNRQAFIIALIKPQFEVKRGQVGKGGVVRDPLLHQEVIQDLKTCCEQLGWSVLGHIESPLVGPKGNREFLMALKR